MRLHERVKQIRKDQELSRAGLHRRIIEIFGENALSYSALKRIESGIADGRMSSYQQICEALGISIQELKKGTVEDSARFELIRAQDYKGKYVYPKNASAEILNNNKCRFFAVKLIVKSGGETSLEQDSAKDGKCRKWIYVLSGRLNCFVDNEKIILRKGDSLHFDSSLPHYFKNPYSASACCIIIQDPRYL